MKKDMAVRQGSAFMKEDAAALKGIAILMMMLHHCFRDASLYDGYVISFAPFPEQTVVRFALFCKICVSLFAFVSGYAIGRIPFRRQDGLQNGTSPRSPAIGSSGSS